jgi:putative ABC transport system permease protein
LRGRVFSSEDPWNGPRNVVVSQKFAARMWPGVNPIGKRLYWGGTSGNTRTVIGVVGDIRDVSPQQDALPMLFLPYNQLPMGGMTLVVRTVGDPMDAAQAIRAAIRALDPRLPVPGIRPLARNHASALATPRFNLLLIAGFAIVALLFASSGLYAVVAFNVARRRREIGVRLAIGAMPVQVIRTFLVHGLSLAMFGIAAGLAAAVMLTRLMRALLYEIGPGDPLTFAVVTALLALIALLAAYVPARRAADVGPSEALRSE